MGNSPRHNTTTISKDNNQNKTSMSIKNHLKMFGSSFGQIDQNVERNIQ